MAATLKKAPAILENGGHIRKCGRHLGKWARGLIRPV